MQQTVAFICLVFGLALMAFDGLSAATVKRGDVQIPDNIVAIAKIRLLPKAIFSKQQRQRNRQASATHNSELEAYEDAAEDELSAELVADVYEDVDVDGDDDDDYYDY